MKDITKKILLTLTILSTILCICCYSNTISVHAKAIKENGTYSASNSQEAMDHFGNRITKVKYKGKKVTFKGAFYYTYATDEGNIVDMVKYKKMTFTISSKCKFYNYDINEKVAKKTFKTATSPLKEKVGVKFIVKGGKIVKMWYSTNNSFS